MIDTINQPGIARRDFRFIKYLQNARSRPSTVLFLVSRDATALTLPPRDHYFLSLLPPFAVTGSFPPESSATYAAFLQFSPNNVSRGRLVAERRSNQNSALATIDTSGPAE